VDADFGLSASQVETIWVFVGAFTSLFDIRDSAFDILLVEKVERVEKVDSLAGFAG